MGHRDGHELVHPVPFRQGEQSLAYLIRVPHHHPALVGQKLREGYAPGLELLFGLGELGLAQLAIIVLFVVNDVTSLQQWLPAIVALSAIALVAAFWFASLAGHLRREEIHRLQAIFAKERENLRVKAEREKTKVVRQSHKTIVAETRKVSAKANVKVGAALAGAAGVGLLMVMANFITLGLLVVTGAGGALGGYLLKRKWVGQNMLANGGGEKDIAHLHSRPRGLLGRISKS